MEVLKALKKPSGKIKLVFGAVYLTVYFLLAMLNIGPEAKGTAIFLVLLLSWPVLFVAVATIGGSHTQQKLFFVVLMLVHYVITLALFYWLTNGFNFVSPRFLEVWNRDYGLQILTAVWYFFGQIVIWLAFLQADNHRQKRSDE